MSTPYQRLLKLDVSDLEAAASAWGSLARKLETAHKDHRRHVTGPLSTWEGDSAKAGKPVLEQLQGQLEAAHVDAILIVTVLDTTRVAMKQAQTDLKNAIRSAEQDDYVIDDTTGQVSLPKWLIDARHDPDQAAVLPEYTKAMTGHQDKINQAIKDAKKASDKGEKAIGEVRAQLLDEDDALGQTAVEARDVTKDLGIGPYGIPDGKDVKENAEWWKHLSHDEQQMYIAMYPKQIGGLDGLPAVARDDANRLLLDQYLNPAPPEHPINPDVFNKQQDGLRALKKKLDAADGAPKGKELYLLKVRPEDDGRAIVAMGNPDTADNTAVLVPGVNSDLEGTGGEIDRIDALQGAAMRSAPGDSTAVISWLDYDPPNEKVPDLDLDIGVISQDRAKEGGETLRHFTEGTRAAQGSHHGNLTVIGHSYGSTTVGAGAAGGHGLGADNIVAVGSPGMTVEHAKDLNIDPKHVFIGSAKDDPIINNFAGTALGADTRNQTFGAQNFKVDTSGHSGYWGYIDNIPSESLTNQGRIITGYPPSTVPARNPDHYSGGIPNPFPNVPQGIK
ncbi:alpha/beta hydrolase [Streptomyces sp. NPDC050617]|uniref:alpha/beta hydrolase n=1 Tax=Streptomyces sp. NPDC050617 TaxID=3154628 RepID=UPI00341E5B1A